MAESGSHPSSISGSREWLPARSFAPLLTSRSWFFQSQEVSSQFGGYWFRRTEGRALVRSQSVCSRVQLGANVSQQARGFILSICSCLWAMLALAGPVYSEDAPRENTPNQQPPAQALTFANLEGVKITIKLVTEMLVQREGFQVPQHRIRTGASQWGPKEKSIGRSSRPLTPGLVTAQDRNSLRRPRWINLGIR
jgi:hypothetical protein